MRRKDKEILDQNTIQEILLKSEICRISLNDIDYSYILPLNYGYQDNSLYFHCAKLGKKVDLIRKNNKASFLIEQYYEIAKDDISCKWTTKYRSIIGCGTIEIINEIEQKRNGLDVIMKHYGKFDNEYSNKQLENVLVLRLNIEKLKAKQSV